MTTIGQVADPPCHDRKRRVKCDETKPECRRCQNFGCTCDGYESPDRRVSRTVPRRLLVPRTQSVVQIQPQRSSNAAWKYQMLDGARQGQIYKASLVGEGCRQLLMDQSVTMASHCQLYPNTATDNPAFPPIIHSPSMTIFESEQETHYFRFYCDTTAHQLSGVSVMREWAFVW